MKTGLLGSKTGVVMTLQGVSTMHRAGVCNGQGVDVWEAAFSVGDRMFAGDAENVGGPSITAKGLRGSAAGAAALARPTRPSGVVGAPWKRSGVCGHGALRSMVVAGGGARRS